MKPVSVERELMDQVAQALADPHPLSTLNLASGLAAALDPTIPDDASAGPTGLPPAAEFVGMLAEDGGIESAALAWVLGHLSLDDLARARALRSVDPTRLPAWMRELGGTEVTAAFQTADVLRDHTTIALGARLDSFDISVVAHIDLNFGAVKDAFTMAAPLDVFVDRFAVQAADSDKEGAELDVSLADARAQLEEAVAVGRTLELPYETESWPLEQPLIEFLLRCCPPGGKVWTRPSWTDADSDGVLDEFFATRLGEALADDDDHEMLLAAWLIFATDMGMGDPFLVSGEKLEIFLMGWLGQQWHAKDEELAKLPTVLHAFVPYAHRQRGVPASVTSEVVHQLDALSRIFLARLTPGAD